MGADFNSPLAQAASTMELCSIIQQSCTGDYVQYHSLASHVVIWAGRSLGVGMKFGVVMWFVGLCILD